MSSSTPYPYIWTPPPPEDLRDLLEKALNDHDRSFPRAVAAGTLLYKLEKWLEEFVAYCEPRGGTYGMNLGGLMEMVRRKESAPDGVVTIVEPQEDGSVIVRESTAESEGITLENSDQTETENHQPEPEGD